MDSTKQEPEEISEIIDLEDYVKEEPADLNVLELQLLEEDEQKNANPDYSAFSCEYCGARFKQNSVLRMHQNYKKVGVKYTCRLGDCDRTFFCKQQKNDHVELHHPPNEPGIWKCSVCSFIAKSSNGLKSHSLIHTAKHRCDQCLRSFKTRILLNSHRKTHKIKSTCNKCGLEFETRKGFREHQSQMGNFKCLLCDEEFECEHGRSQHLYKDHEKGFGCLKCPYIAKDRCGLEDHCKDKHRVHLAAVQHNALLEKFETIGVGMKFKCDRCGLSFEEKQKLCAHMLDHSTKLICSCNECGAKFISLEYLKLHQKFFSGKFKCYRKKCDKVFRCQRAMKTHLKEDHVWKCSHCLEIFKTEKKLLVHEKEKNHTDHVWKCSHCLEIFKTKKKLLVHEKEKHHKYNSVACGKCGKTFKNAKFLKLHRQSMSKYTCVICDQEFQCKFGLSQHIQQKHKNEVKCRKCPFVGKDLKSLRLHYNYRHKIQPVTLEPSLEMSDTHNKYACNKCGLKFETRKGFREHQSQLGNLKCLFCDEEFECEHARNQHLERDHEIDIEKESSKLETFDVEMKFECDHCGLYFDHKGKLAYHMTHHTTKLICPCTECGSIFTSLKRLTMHQSSNFKCKKINCKKVFKCKGALKIHLREDHSWKCPDCSKFFMTMMKLRAHCSNQHSKQHKNKFQCDLCELSFLKGKKLSFHKWSFHQMFSCSKCEEKFKTLNDLNEHEILIHPNLQTKEKQKSHLSSNQRLEFVSEDSNESIVSKQEQEEFSTVSELWNENYDFKHYSMVLLNHQELSSDTSHTFDTKRSVVVSQENGEASAENDPVTPCVKRKHFACRKCGKTFKDASTLKVHRQRMSKLLCQICDQEFQCMFGLRQHIQQKHENEVKCRKCPYVGKDLRSLRLHCNNRHNVQPVTLEPSLEMSDTRNKYACSKCGLEFGTRKDFRGHQSQIGNFKCLLCDEEFECEYAKSQHLERDHGEEIIHRSQLATLQPRESSGESLLVEEKFQCDHCELSFNKKINLKYHMGVHLKFVAFCEGCGARFDRRLNFTNHRKRNSGKFKCSRKNCDKVFRCKLMIKIHAREEHEQKWKCSECPKIFKTLKKFKSHCTLYHKNLRDIAEPLCISKDPKSTKNQCSNQQEMCSEVSQRLDTNISTVVQHEQEDSSVTETLGMNVYIKEEPEVSYVLKFPSEDEY